MGWWTDKRFRMIQNNLRDIDAGMNVERYVDTLEEFGANVCMVGCGGITSFYPTQLECQRPSPYLHDDFFGKLVDRCHARNIRVIARFDFSKTHIGFLETHPAWFSRFAEGEPILYNDTAATCVNGPYQQECSLQILEEAITQYPVDGVFFNMFGYQTRDYSGRYVGICQCENCRRRFEAYAKMALPVQESEGEAYRRYQEFKEYTTQELLQRIYRKVKDLNPEIAVCTYSDRHVDLVRSESNSAVDRPLPLALSESEQNVARVQETFADRYASNCAINAVDIYYRFMGVSPYLNELRLCGNMAVGGNLDWCIIGDFETYPDRRNFEGTKRIFRFHKKYERLYSALRPCADILLVRPQGGGESARREYSGLYRMLREAHLPFEIFEGGQEPLLARRAGGYRAVLLPGTPSLAEETVQALAQSGAVIVGTGLALQGQEQALRQLFGIRLGESLEQVRGCYMATEPKRIFQRFSDRDWVYLDQAYRYMEPENGNCNLMPLIRAGMYGPPERCFGYQVTEQSSVSLRQGKSVYFPWMIGSLYETQGYEDFRDIFLDVLQESGALRRGRPRAEIEAPACVESFFHRCGENRYLLQLLNYSGCNGTSYTAPLPVEVRISFSGLTVDKVQELLLSGRRRLPFERVLTVTVQGAYKAILVTAIAGTGV